MHRSPEPFAVTGAAVIDGTGGPVLPGRTVLVRGGVIERVDPAGAVPPPPPGIRRIEGTGRSLLPGFIDTHVHRPAEVAKALDAGVTELAHWPFGEELPGDLIRRMAASMTVVPTLHIDPSPARRRGVRAFVAAGGRVVYGTDLGNQGPPPAVDVAELELLVEAGLSPVGAVAAATSNAAEHLGLRAIGRVAPGWVADLLLVDGDPLEDLRALTRVRLVSRAGWIAG